MKDLTLTIQGLLYTTEQINKARKYAERVFDTTLEVCLEDTCLTWIDKAIEQREIFESMQDERQDT
jgi:hypothetical protein